MSHVNTICIIRYNLLETPISVTNQNNSRNPVWLTHGFLTTFSMKYGSRKNGIFVLGAAIQICYKEWPAVICDVYKSTTQRSQCNHGQGNSQQAQHYRPKVSYNGSLYWQLWFEFLWLMFLCCVIFRLVSAVTWCTLQQRTAVAVRFIRQNSVPPLPHVPWVSMAHSVHLPC